MHESHNKILTSSWNFYLRLIRIISKGGRFYAHLFLLNGFMSNALCSCEQFTSVILVQIHNYEKKKINCYRKQIEFFFNKTNFQNTVYSFANIGKI